MRERQQAPGADAVQPRRRRSRGTGCGGACRRSIFAALAVHMMPRRMPHVCEAVVHRGVAAWGGHGHDTSAGGLARPVVMACWADGCAAICMQMSAARLAVCAEAAAAAGTVAVWLWRRKAAELCADIAPPPLLGYWRTCPLPASRAIPVIVVPPLCAASLRALAAERGR